MEFCKQFNAQTASKRGETVPVVVTVYKDKSFDFILRTPPTAELILKKANLKKGSSVPNKTKVNSVFVFIHHSNRGNNNKNKVVTKCPL